MSKEQKKPAQTVKNPGKLVGIITTVAVLITAVSISIYNTPANRMSRHMDRGVRYLEEQDYEQAVIEFDKVISTDPMNTNAYTGKAQAYDGLGDTEKAIETLQTGYEATGDEQIQATWLSSQLDLAQKYMEEMNYEQADIEFDKAIVIDPMNTDPYLGKAQVYEAMGDLDKAYEALQTGYEKTASESILNRLQELQPIVWTDTAFEGLIREYLKRPEGDIRKVDVCDIEVIQIIGSYIMIQSHGNQYESETQSAQIQSLEDLKYFTSLKELDIEFVQINDISALADLINLESLSVHGNQLNDISVLSNMPNLEYLDLTGSQISDISALAGLTNLRYLQLETNPLSDISALSGLVNLEYLNLDHWYYYEETKYQISDISALAGLTNLEHLRLDWNQISDISALAGLTNLKILCLNDNQISDISALSGLTNLKELSLTDNQIRDVSALSNLTNLKFLSLGNNPISDYSPVSFVEELSY